MVKLNKHLTLSFMALLLSQTLAIAATSIDDINASLLKEIKQSQQRLNNSEQRIAKENNAILKRIHKKQELISKLRKEAAIAQRLADEKTLGLEQLQARLQQWQEQHQYQKHLLVDFINASLPANSEEVTKVDEGLKISDDLEQAVLLIKNHVTHLQSPPSWHQAKVIQKNGSVETAQVLNLGPISWYWQTDNGTGGLLNSEKTESLPTATKEFTGSARKELALLFETGQSQLQFDPTLKHASQLEQQNESLWQHLNKGGVWVIPILLFALVAIAIAVAKFIQLWRLPKLVPLLADRIEMLSQKTKTALNELVSLRKELQGAQAELLDITIKTPSSEQRDDRLFACLLENKHQLEHFLGAIAITAAVSPLLGLLGTVSGMIETFKLMTIFGTGDAATVSSGISEALITTELGLVVAIPALLLHALLSRQVKGYTHQLEATAIKLSKLDLPQEAV